MPPSHQDFDRMHHFQTFTHDSDNEEHDGLNAING